MSKFQVGHTGAAGKVTAQVMIMGPDGALVPKGKPLGTKNIVTALGLKKLTPSKLRPLEGRTLTSSGRADRYDSTYPYKYRHNLVIGTGTQTESTNVSALAQYVRGLTDPKLQQKRLISTVDAVSDLGVPMKVQTYEIPFLFTPDSEGRTHIYSEVGLATNRASSSPLLTYTYFKNPITGEAETITVLGDEYLSVTYTYQVQWEVLSGFMTQSSDLRGDYVDNQPIGPIPVTGEGFPVGTEAYVLLASTNTDELPYSTRGGVYYFDETTAAQEVLWDPSSMDPPTRANMGTSGYLRETWVNATHRYNRTSGGRIGLRFPSNRRPLNKDAEFTVTATSRVLPPGTLTTDKAIKVVGYGDVGLGGIVMFTKPITITKDSKFEVPRHLTGLYKFTAPENSTFIDPEGV